MLQIPCPHCGLRDQNEFTYAGDASLKRPADAPNASDEDWVRYLYLRDNPAGKHIEYWQHALGCRQWLKVVRDTRTQEILACGGPTFSLEEGR